MKASIIVAAAALGAAVSGGSAFADARDFTQTSVTVYYGDLDLERAADRAALRDRVSGALFRACPITGGISASERYECRQNAFARVVAESNDDVKGALTETGDRSGLARLASRG